jgi:hypothetical protein
VPRLVQRDPDDNLIDYNGFQETFLKAVGQKEKKAIAKQKKKGKEKLKGKEGDEVDSGTKDGDSEMCIIYRTTAPTLEIKRENQRVVQEAINPRELPEADNVVPIGESGVTIKTEYVEEDEDIGDSESAKEDETVSSEEGTRRFPSPLPPEDDSDELGINLELVQLGFVERKVLAEITLEDSVELPNDSGGADDVEAGGKDGDEFSTFQHVRPTVEEAEEFEDFTSSETAEGFESLDRSEVLSEFDASAFVEIQMENESESSFSPRDVRVGTPSPLPSTTEGTLLNIRM